MVSQVWTEEISKILVCYHIICQKTTYLHLKTSPFVVHVIAKKPCPLFAKNFGRKIHVRKLSYFPSDDFIFLKCDSHLKLFYTEYLLPKSRAEHIVRCDKEYITPRKALFLFKKNHEIFWVTPRACDLIQADTSY